MGKINNWIKSTDGKMAVAHLGHNGRGGHVFTAEIKEGSDGKWHAYLWTSHAIFYGQYEPDTDLKQVAEVLRQEAIEAAHRVLKELEE